MVRLVEVVTEEQLDQVRRLFKEYTESLGFDLDFQDYEKEFAELPGEYSQPDGQLIVAMQGERIVGCVALRKFSDKICEMKRLYVQPEFRGRGIGKQLAKAIITEARKIGYTSMQLDTVPWMKEAITLYKSLGFKEIPPYRYNPIEGALYLELILNEYSPKKSKKN
ncbi:MAG: GNAT family N-acetyltransferase [Candidatus Hermodarchaeota archaeon]